MMGTITRAASGSAHHQPTVALRRSPLTGSPRGRCRRVFDELQCGENDAYDTLIRCCAGVQGVRRIDSHIGSERKKESADYRSVTSSARAR
jgi:hypothetical protein